MISIPGKFKAKFFLRQARQRVGIGIKGGTDWLLRSVIPRLPKMKELILLMVFVTTNIETTSGKAILTGEAHFSRAGEVAGPITYQDVTLRIDFGDMNRLKDQAERVTDVVLRELETKLRYSKNATIHRIKHRLQPAMITLNKSVGRLEKMTSLMEQRSLAVMAAVGAVGMIGSAIYAAHEVMEMAKRQRGMKIRLAKLDEEMAALREAFNKWSKTDFDMKLENVAVERLNQEILLAARRVDDVLSGVYATKQHRLHPSLVDVDALGDIAARVKSYMKRKGTSAVFGFKDELLNLPISYIQGSRGVLIMLHIPHVTDTTMAIRDLFHLDGAVLEGEGRLMRLQAREPYIAVNRKLMAHQTYTADEIQSCHKVSQTFLCTHDSIMLKTVASCTAALFKKDTEMATMYCERETIQTDQPVVQINASAYVINKGEDVTTRCPGKAPEFHHVSKPEVVRLEWGCTLHSKNFQITQPLKPYKELIQINHALRLLNVEMLSVDNMEADMAPPLKELNMLEGLPGDDEELDDLEESSGRLDWWTWCLVGAGAIGALVLLLILGCWIIYHKGRLSGKKSKHARSLGHHGDFFRPPRGTGECSQDGSDAEHLQLREPSNQRGGGRFQRTTTEAGDARRGDDTVFRGPQVVEDGASTFGPRAKNRSSRLETEVKGLE